MASPYETQTISGYNANPPSDDATQVASNQIEWQKHIDKIGGPLKTLSESINTEILSAFDKIAFNGVSAKTANYTVLSSDQGKLITMTGSNTVTLPAADNGPNFFIAVKNIGTGTVTVDGNGSETIDGSASFSLSQNDFSVLVSSGTTWTSMTAQAGVGSGGFIGTEIFTSSGTWTKPSGTNAVEVWVIGGGGGAGGVATAGLGEAIISGGGGGGGAVYRYISSGLGATETVTVGSGGSGGAAGANNGSQGGTSSFGSFGSANGGAGGTAGSAIPVSTVTSNANFVGAGGTTSVGNSSTTRQERGQTAGISLVFDNGLTLAAPPAAPGLDLFGHARFGYRVMQTTDGLVPGHGAPAVGGWQLATADAGGDGADGIVVVKSYR